MATQNLGRLQKVELREAWTSESSDFTPWLATEENLKLLGETIGIELDVYDITTERGFEIKTDLNFPLILEKSYDIVIDIGTLEHCFNIGQALMNMASLVGEKGFILHENPYNWGNHGFYKSSQLEE